MNNLRSSAPSVPPGARLSWVPYSASFDVVAFPAGSRVLDVGCGPGNHLKDLTARGCRPTGLEPDRASVERLRREGFAAQVGVAERLPFPDGAFDGLLCNGDTLYQSVPRLRRHYVASGLRLEEAIPSPRFLGLPVFIAHRLRKGTGRAS